MHGDRISFFRGISFPFLDYLILQPARQGNYPFLLLVLGKKRLTFFFVIIADLLHLHFLFRHHIFLEILHGIAKLLFSQQQLVSCEHILHSLSEDIRVDIY